MVQDTTRTPRGRWKLHLLLLCLVLGIGAVVYWVLRPQPVVMRLVGCTPLVCPGIPSYDPRSLAPTRDNILIAGKSHAVCYRWDGTRRWQVALPSPAITMQTMSPDGRVYEVLVEKSDRYTVFSWHDGRLLGSTPLPLGAGRPSIRALSSGRVICWSNEAPVIRLILIDGNRIVARGSTGVPGGVYPAAVEGRFSTDGQVFLAMSGASFTYFTIHVTGTTITVKPVYTAADLWSRFIRNDLLLTHNGAVYDDRGRISPPSNWQISADNLTPGDVVVQTRGRYSDFADAVRVFHPRTGVAWTIPPHEVTFCTATADGRYLLADDSSLPRMETDALVQQLGRLPIIGERFYNLKAYPACLVLYEQPGHARAYIPLDYLMRALRAERKYFIRAANIAPDGRSVTLLGQMDFQYYALRYAW